jgi:hypothetical protein
MDSLRFLAQYDEEYTQYRFLVATKIGQDGVDCKRAIQYFFYKLMKLQYYYYHTATKINTCQLLEAQTYYVLVKVIITISKNSQYHIFYLEYQKTKTCINLMFIYI